MQLTTREIREQIYTVREKQVMLDTDLAALYEIETYNLNKAVKRNIERFPSDFMFQLTREEWIALTFQIGMSKKMGRGGRRTLPYGFTQEGVAMLSSILNSERAMQVNITILRTFAKIRLALEIDANLSKKLEQLGLESKQQFTNISVSLQSLHVAVSLLAPPIIATGKSVKSGPHLPHEGDDLLQKKSNLTLDMIQTAVEKYFKLTQKELKAPTRSAEIALARQVWMYLIRKYLQVSFREIGGFFGGKDHTTVLHACRKIEASLLKKDSTLCEALEAIQRWLALKGIHLDSLPSTN